jgi:hypothetical protein
MGARTVPSLARLAALVAILAVAGPAAAKTEEKPKATEGPHLRYARSYAEAMAEAKERGCVVFATFHEDG